MTCEHAETTTIAWLYGEGPEDHLHHVATCEACQRVLRTHSEVMQAVGPVLDQLATPASTMPSAVQAPPPVQAPANRPWGLVIAAVVAAAAVALIALTPWLTTLGQTTQNIAETPAPEHIQAPDHPASRDDLAPRVVQESDDRAPDETPGLQVTPDPALNDGLPAANLLVSVDDLPEPDDELGQGLNDIFDELDSFEQELLTL